MNLDKCPYNLSEDYEKILEYLITSKKLLTSYIPHRDVFCSVATCGLSHGGKITFFYDNSLDIEHIKQDKFVEHCKNNKIKFIMP